MQRKLTATLSLITALLLGSTAYAGNPPQKGQGPHGAGQNAGYHTGTHRQLADYLELDDAQRAKFDQMHNDYREQRKSIKEAELSQEERHARMMAAKEQHRADMKALLNEEQFSRYEAYRNAHHGKGGNKGNKSQGQGQGQNKQGQMDHHG